MRQEGPPSSRLRVKFSKTGAVRFLSHLDLLKCLERAMRRAQIAVAYTEGFHARIKVHFGPALPTGQASSCEWMDIDMGESMAATAFAERMNATLPEGLRVLAAREVPLSSASLASRIRRAVYRVQWAPLQDQIDGLLRQQEIPLQKKNKTLNLRGFVEDLRLVSGAAGQVSLEIVLRVGQEGGVRPEDVLEALAPNGEWKTALIERTALLQQQDDAWVEPWPQTGQDN